MIILEYGVYSLIAFDGRVTFGSKRPVTALCVCVCCIIMQSLTHTMQQTHMHKAVTRHVEAKKLLSRRRQSEYSSLVLYFWFSDVVRCWIKGSQPFSAAAILWVLPFHVYERWMLRIRLRESYHSPRSSEVRHQHDVLSRCLMGTRSP